MRIVLGKDTIEIEINAIYTKNKMEIVPKKLLQKKCNYKNY